MEVQERVDREINLVELFWQFLLSWRQIICFGIIFAVLLGGLKYVRDVRIYQASQNVDIEQQEESLPEAEMQQVLEARNLMARIEEYENYLDNSTLMQINLYEKPVVELQYYIDSDYTFNYTQDTQNDYTTALMALYYNYIISGEMNSKVAKEVGLSVSEADVSELWSISQAENSMSIKFTCPQKEKMDDVAEIIKGQLDKKETEFQEVGAHKLKLMDESENVIVDYGLIDRKNTISNNIATINTQLNTLKTGLTEQQLALVENKQAEEESELVAAKPKISKKYTVLGAVLGIFLIAVWIACKMLFTAKLQSPEEIRALYNARLLGAVGIQPRKKPFLSMIDNKILGIKNRRKKKLTVQQQVKVIVANIALYCKQEEIDCIYMSGSEFENMDSGIIDMLRRELSAQGIQVKEGGNIFYDAESLKLSTEMGHIVFVEQVGKSIYDEILNELNLAKEQKNNILGVVVLV